jgi:membrane protein required for colicin V production
MTLDLAVLCVLALFGIFGAISGAAKQIANVLALGAAYLSAGPVAKLAAPWLAKALGTSLLVATGAATLFVFLAVWIPLRLALVTGLEKLIAGEERQHSDVNRALGGVLGALKAATLVWVLFSALTFVERNVQVGGRRFSLPAKDSQVLAAVRRYNLFELAPVIPTRDLARFAEAARDPGRANQLADDPAWQRLQQDPRFRELLSDPRLKSAIESGDFRALLESDAMKRLLADPSFADQLEKLGTATK